MGDSGTCVLAAFRQMDDVDSGQRNSKVFGHLVLARAATAGNIPVIAIRSPRSTGPPKTIT